ncbi:MAG TPA: hypothetical protein VKB69_14210 [Micromonosporaceae bacterium]|nr:hypothetical protein [Micromonosporaceae bacterium]
MRAIYLRTPLAVSTVLALAACTTPARAPAPGPVAARTTPAATTTAGPGLTKDPEHAYRLVNLHIYNGTPGADVDIYPAASSDLAELGGTPTPVGTPLGYGHMTDFIAPGAVKSPVGTLRYGLSVRPHDAGQPGAANLTTDLYDSNDGVPWKHAIVVLGGTGNGLSSEAFYDTSVPPSGNTVPAVNPTRVAIRLDAEFAGDPNGPSPVNATILIGGSGGCLAADSGGDTAASGGGVAAVSPGGIDTAFTSLDPNATSIGFWIASGPNPSQGSCSGTPAFTAPLSGLAAGSRALVFVYGPDAAHLAAVVVPLDS